MEENKKLRPVDKVIRFLADSGNEEVIQAFTKLQKERKENFDKVLADMDSAKKVYNTQNYVKGVLRTDNQNFDEIIERMSNPEIIRLLHAAMGLSTEAAEILDAMKKFIFYGKPLDITNIKEEQGDVLWYVALSIDVMKTSFEEIMEGNLEKLRKRYPEHFTNMDAINRDKDHELSHIKGEVESIKGAVGEAVQVGGNLPPVEQKEVLMRVRVNIPAELEHLNLGHDGLLPLAMGGTNHENLVPIGECKLWEYKDDEEEVLVADISNVDEEKLEYLERIRNIKEFGTGEFKGEVLANKDIDLWRAYRVELKGEAEYSKNNIITKFKIESASLVMAK